MANPLLLTGVQSTIAGLQAHNAKMVRAVARGLKKAGLFLQRESMKLVPVDTGNLRASAFTRFVDSTDVQIATYKRTLKSGKVIDVSAHSKHSTKLDKLAVEVGYTAAYGVYVHENMQARHKPGKTAKFLETPAREKKGEIRDIIRKELTKP